MRKPVDLRNHLSAALPDLQREPERLVMLVTKGSVNSTATAALSWEYAYTLRLLFLDWVLHADSIMAPLLAWVKHHQNELLANPSKNGIRFEAEHLNTSAMDLVIDLDLTERVLCRPREGVEGGLDLHHLNDTPPLHLPKNEHWRVFLQGVEVAQWDLPANPPHLPHLMPQRHG